MQQLTMEEVKIIFDSFDRDFKSVVLSTLTEDGFPHASYAPVIRRDGCYYFLISEAANHYDNINANPKASIMFLEDELSTSNVFFRKRLTYTANLEFSKNSEVEKEFVNTHGELVDMLINKMDFHIIKALPIEGKLVLGPGKAYLIKDGNIQQDTAGGKGHKRK